VKVRLDIADMRQEIRIALLAQGDRVMESNQELTRSGICSVEASSSLAKAAESLRPAYY